MDGGTNSTRGSVRDARVVVLSQDASLAWLTDSPGARVVLAHVRSGYEAAAELLAAPAAALVVEMRLLGARHVSLLEIARDLDVEVLGVGSLPIGMTAEDLSGVRLIARGDLARAVRALARLRPPPEPDDEPPRTDGEQADLAAAAGPAEPEQRTSPEPPAPDDDDDEAPGADGEAPAFAEADHALGAMELPPAIAKALRGTGRRSAGIEARRPPKRPGGGSPDRDSGASAPVPVRPEAAPSGAAEQSEGLLTTEEINALLGDDS